MLIHKFPNILETYFVEEAKTIPTASWGKITEGDGYLGPRIKRLTGAGIMSGWALPVTCPDGNIMSILDMIVGTGIDALNPLEPVAGMDEQVDGVADGAAGPGEAAQLVNDLADDPPRRGHGVVIGRV